MLRLLLWRTDGRNSHIFLGDFVKYYLLLIVSYETGGHGEHDAIELHSAARQGLRGRIEQPLLDIDKTEVIQPFSVEYLESINTKAVESMLKE